MNLVREGVEWLRGSARLSHQPRRPVPERLDIGGTAVASGTADDAAGCAMNKAAPLRPASWDEALDRIAWTIEQTQQRYGRDAVGVFGGGGLTNEKAYLLGKFARVALRTSQIDYNGRFCMSSAAAASIKAFGMDRGLPFPLADIPHAETHPAGRQQCGGNHAAHHAVFRGAGEERRLADRGRSARDAHSAAADVASADHARAPTSHWPMVCCTSPSKQAISTRSSSPRARTGSSGAHVASRYWPDRVERITGIPEKQLRSGSAASG